MKYNKLKKLLINNLILCGSFLLTTNTGLANSELMDLTNNSIVNSFGGFEQDTLIYVSATSDGGFITSGYSKSTDIGFTNNGLVDAMIIKYDKNGNQEWIKNFGGSGSDYFYSVKELSSGGYIAAGESDSTDAGFDNKGNYDAVVVKYDKSGNQEWVRSFSGTKIDYFDVIMETRDKELVVIGASESTDVGFSNNGSRDAIIVKYDKDGNELWVKNFGGSNMDYFESVVETKNKDLVIVGYSNSTDAGFVSKGGLDAFMVKYDKDGNQQWIKNFGGSGGERAQSIANTSDGGFIVAGYSNSTNAGFANKGVIDSFVVKFDKDGNQEWIKGFGGNNSDYFESVIELSNGDYIAAGYSYSTNAGFVTKGEWDAVLIRYDKNGQQKQLMTFGDSGNDYLYFVSELLDGSIVTVGTSTSASINYINTNSSDVIIVVYNDECENNKSLFDSINNNVDINKNGNDYIRDVHRINDNEYVVAGYTNSTNIGTANKGGLDAYISKYNSSNKSVWTSSFGGSSDDYFRSVRATLDRGFVAVGYSFSTNAGFANKGGCDAVIVKYDKDGKQEWFKTINGNDNDYFNSVVQISDGGFVVAGYSFSTNAGFTSKGGSDAMLLKYDKDGNQQWFKTFGGSKNEYLNSIYATSDGEFIVVGESNSTNAGFANKGYYDTLVIKYDSNGEQVWMKTFGGSGNDYLLSVLPLSDGGYISVGYSNSSNAGFDIKGAYDGIIVKYDEDGNQQWLKNFGGNNDDAFYSVIETQDKGFIAVGYSYSTDSGFVHKGKKDGIMVKYDKDGNQQLVKSFGGSNYDHFNSIVKLSKNKIIIVGDSSSSDANFKNNNHYDGVILQCDESIEIQSTNTLTIKNVKNTDKLAEMREIVNNLPEGKLKTYLSNRLNNMNLGFDELEHKTMSANLDVYIKTDNMLSLSLDTNSVTFENYSGIEDVEMLGVVNITVNSSLPYTLSAYIPSEITNSDKSNTMDLDIFNIRENTQGEYKQFENHTDKLVLKETCEKGNGNIHVIDMKLSSDDAHKADIYKTVVKFEIEQK